MTNPLTGKVQYSLKDWYRFHKGSFEEWVEYRHPTAALWMAVIGTGILFSSLIILWFFCVI